MAPRLLKLLGRQHDLDQWIPDRGRKDETEDASAVGTVFTLEKGKGNKTVAGILEHLRDSPSGRYVVVVLPGLDPRVQLGQAHVPVVGTATRRNLDFRLLPTLDPGEIQGWPRSGSKDQELELRYEW